MQTTNQYVSNRVHPHFFEKIDGFRNHLALVNPEKTEDLQLWLDDINQQIIVFMIPKK